MNGDEIRLFASLTKDGASVRVRYTIVNSMPDSIYIFNMLYDEFIDGVYNIDVNRCNVIVEGEYVVISKKMVGVPKNMLVEIVNVPCVTEVRAREDFSEEIVLDTPLAQWTPYSKLNKNTIKKLPVLFEVGYLVWKEGTNQLIREVPVASGKGLQFRPFSVSSQSTIISGPYDPINVFSD